MNRHIARIAACLLMSTLVLPQLLAKRDITGKEGRNRIKMERLQDERQRVWTEWCHELAVRDTLPRLAMTPLEQAAACRWVLPDSLEPHATMPFYAGTKGEKPAQGYPAYIYLHGSGPKDAEWATGLKLALAFDDAPSFYAIPQIPNEGAYYRWWQTAKQWAWGHLLRQLLANAHIDPARLYLFGISEGGYGSQRLASYYADYLAAAAPMAGGEPLRNAPAENLMHTPLSLVTGERDAMFYRNLLTARTKQRLDSLERLLPGNFAHRVYLEKDHGHGVTYGVSTPWMKGYRRTAQPRHFRWENFEMDGVKRNAFYNLEVLREDGSERHDYEMSIDDNRITLQVNEVHYIITERDPNWGIELNNTRTYTAAQHGQVRIYLSEELIDLKRPVTITVNGAQLPTQRPVLSRAILRQSAELFGDPLRLFPAAIEVEW